MGRIGCLVWAHMAWSVPTCVSCRSASPLLCVPLPQLPLPAIAPAYPDLACVLFPLLWQLPACIPNAAVLRAYPCSPPPPICFSSPLLLPFHPLLLPAYPFLPPLLPLLFTITCTTAISATTSASWHRHLCMTLLFLMLTLYPFLR